MLPEFGYAIPVGDEQIDRRPFRLDSGGIGPTVN